MVGKATSSSTILCTGPIENLIIVMGDITYVFFSQDDISENSKHSRSPEEDYSEQLYKNATKRAESANKATSSSNWYESESRNSSKSSIEGQKKEGFVLQRHVLKLYGGSSRIRLHDSS